MANRNVKTKPKEERLDIVLRKFEGITKNPEKYISSQPTHKAAITACTKTLFDAAASHAEDNLALSNPLSELITEGFDEEQIWQELELQNEPCVGSLMGNVARLVAGHKKLFLQEPKVERLPSGNQEEIEDGDEHYDDDQEEEEDNEIDMDDDNEDEDDDDDSEEERTRSKSSKGKGLPKDSQSSDDESDTNFDIDEMHSRTRNQQKKKSADKSRIEKEAPKRGASIVDDQFFKLDDMERFLEMEDAKEAKRLRGMDQDDVSDDDDEDEDEEESLDFFQDDPSDDEGMDDDDDDDDDPEVSFKESNKSTREWMYSDFFDDPGNQTSKPAKQKKRVQIDEEEEEDEEMDEDDGKDFEEESFEDADEDLLADLRQSVGAGNKDDLLLSGSESEGEEVEDILGGGKKKKGEDQSSFEKRQEKLQSRIKQLEQSNLSEKSWQLIGEVGGTKRPENSLLQETLEFDVASRPAPVITEETTVTLEGLIKQRVLDQAWDDVQRKNKPKEAVTEFKKRVTLDQEKSKMSLGEIYEQEYIKQTQEAGEEKEDPLHTEIKESMDALFIKLDALSNFHFSPKPIAPEIKIVSNAPAISMEEVTPINVAESTLLAPEEVQEKEKGELKGKTEKTLTDRKRELRQKKLKQRARAQEREKRERAVEKMKPGLGNKYSKKAALARLEKGSKAPSSKTTIVKDSSNAKGSLKSSKAFFNKLQEEVIAEVHGVKKKKKKENQLSGSQLKM